MIRIPPAEVERVVRQALEEDLGWGDVTTDSLIAPSLRASGQIVAREPGVLAGLEVAIAVFKQVDASIEARAHKADGDRLMRDDIVVTVAGPAAALLRAERTALNFLQRLSGVATQTSRYVEQVGNLPARVIDTRKTTPGLRSMEKYAVRMGGGHNHRHGLGDGVLVKDNHLVALSLEGAGIGEAVRRARARVPHTIKIEVEADTLDQVKEALEAGADLILLDNMSTDELRAAVSLANGRAVLEASGGVTLDTIRSIAETGVDLISVGALTHSVRALDLALDFDLDG
ncbi:MAG TPA: carboxylating nicotinate-nucleotide diphosphorylase [Dehalococcoidia bacterium]|nr:carboxylating nicotinate-nucleotide diphosphorylase [Dehalococcoidia bacterium]